MAISITKFLSFLPKIVGQATATNNLRPANKKMIFWNILYVVIYFSVFIWTIYNTPLNEDKYGYKGYSFISQIKYCAQLYGASGFLIFMNIRVTYYRNDVRHVYKRLFEMLVDFRSLNIPIHKEFPIFFLVAVLVLSTFVALAIDTIQTSRPVSVCLWICLYIPGFSCVVYICNYVAMFSGCANRFLSINKTLEGYTYPELSCSQIYSLRKKNIRPYPLLKTLPRENINMLDKLFLLHDETCELTQLLNKTCGPELAIYFCLTSATIVSLGYTCALDFIAVSRGDAISEANTRACDFWGLINTFGLVAITFAAANVKRNCEDTSKLLHRLINIYPDLEQHGDIYSLQLSHQNATVTAVGFFTVDKTIILGLLSGCATYLIILIQFSE